MQRSKFVVVQEIEVFFCLKQYFDAIKVPIPTSIMQWGFPTCIFRIFFAKCPNDTSHHIGLSKHGAAQIIIFQKLALSKDQYWFLKSSENEIELTSILKLA